MFKAFKNLFKKDKEIDPTSVAMNMLNKNFSISEFKKIYNNGMSAESEKFGQDVAIAVGKLTAQKITSSDKFKNPCFDCGQALSQLNDNHFALGIDSLKKNLLLQPFVNGNLNQQYLKEISKNVNDGLLEGPKYLNQRMLLIRVISKDNNSVKYSHNI